MQVYLDMDGVQADFFTAWANLFGKSRYKELGDRAAREETIKDLNSRGEEFIEEFFATLPVLPGGQRLIAWLNENNIPFTVLSAPLRGNEQASIRGKKIWLDKYNPGSSATAIFDCNKEKYAILNGVNILIDDYKPYIERWSSNGGIAILYREHNINQAIEQLSKLFQLEVV
jgi:hypothetical protein